jgi:hypothetical protein
MQVRYENPLLLALAAKHVQFKEYVASSLASLAKLDFATALQKTHLAREFALQIEEEASKGSLFLRSTLLFLQDLLALRQRLRLFNLQFLAAQREGLKMHCVRVWVALLVCTVRKWASTGCLQHRR